MNHTIKNYKFKLYLNEKQSLILEKMENASRLFWNACVEQQISAQDRYYYDKITSSKDFSISDAKRLIKISDRQSKKIPQKYIEKINKLVEDSFLSFNNLSQKQELKDEEKKEINQTRSFLTFVFFNFENRLNKKIGEVLELDKNNRKEKFKPLIQYKFKSLFKDNENFHKYSVQKEFTQLKKNKQNNINPIASQFYINISEKAHDSYNQFFNNLKKDPKKAGLPRYKTEFQPSPLGFKNAFKDIWNSSFEENPNSSYAYFQISKSQEDKNGDFDLGYLRFKCFKNFKAEQVRTVQFKKEGNDWFVIFAISVEELYQKPIPKTSVAIDRGVSTMSSLAIVDKNDPNKVIHKEINYPDYITKLEELIPKLQAKLYRRKKDRKSKNFKKERLKISKLQLRLKRQKEVFIKKQSSLIAKKSDKIYIEDLNISNMTKSAKGTVDSPGKNVAQKSGLNRSILSKNWGAFAQKLKEYNQNIIKVNPQYTSQTCSCCGYTSEDNRKGKIFLCKECHYEADADQNASFVIYKVGSGLLKIKKPKKLLTKQIKDG